MRRVVANKPAKTKVQSPLNESLNRRKKTRSSFVNKGITTEARRVHISSHLPVLKTCKGSTQSSETLNKCIPLRSSSETSLELRADNHSVNSTSSCIPINQFQEVKLTLEKSFDKDDGSLNASVPSSQKINVFKDLETAIENVKCFDENKAKLVVVLTDIFKVNPDHKNLSTMKGTGGKSPVRASKESLDKCQDSLVCGDNASIQNIKALFVETDKDLHDVQTSINSMSPHRRLTDSSKKTGFKNKSRESSPNKAESCKKKSPVKRTPKSSPSNQEYSDLPAEEQSDTPKTKRVYKKKSRTDSPEAKRTKKSEIPFACEEQSTCKTDAMKNQVSPSKKRGRTSKTKTEQLKSTPDTKLENSKANNSESPKSWKKKSVLKIQRTSESETKTTPKRSSSPKKSSCSKKSSPKKGADAVLMLDFDDTEMKEQILKSVSLPLPNNYKYQYRASNKTFGRDLSDLIGKVNSALKAKPAVLTSVFGETVLPDSASSPETIENGDEQDIINRNLTSGNVKLDVKEIIEDIVTTICNEFDIADAKVHNMLNPEDMESDTDFDSKDNTDVNNKFEKEVDKDKVVNVSAVKPKVSRSSSNKKDTDNQEPDKPETISIFEMYGLQLKKKSANNDTSCISSSKKLSDEVSEKEFEEENKTFSGSDYTDVNNLDKKLNTSDEDVMLVSKPKSQKSLDSIVISAGEEELETNIKTEKELKKAKFVTVNNPAEPKPIEILRKHEKKASDKKSAFVCDELDMYLQSNNENLNVVLQGKKFSDEQIKDELETAEPDIDEVDGHVFLSFSSEYALKAHVSLESKIDWLTIGQLKKVAALKEMKERQNDAGTRRVTDVKSHDEQKQSFRGIPMRMMKYQKLLKQELEDLLTWQQKTTPFKCPLKPTEKTADVTKIKGWKNKFKNADAIPDATGINISESGKVHWRTEERLLKKFDPVEAKDIGLDLKKKRRKLVTYNKSKRGSKDVNEYQYMIDESVVTERDVYNEEEEMPLPEKIPYHIKYSSQHKYGARKMFVKKMKLDAEDERILKKLGTQQKQARDDDEDMELASVCSKTLSRGLKGHVSVDSAEKISMPMALEAVSALNMKLIAKAKRLSKGFVGKSHGVDEYDPGADDVNEIPDSDAKPDVRRARRTSLRSKSNTEDSCSAPAPSDATPIKAKKEMRCTEPGCRYGCICHLCKLSDSGEEKETDVKPPCDKEYCKLGCICESIDTNKVRTSHCRKPGCMLECKCRPKQPKPDIPRETTKKKKKGRQKRRKSTPVVGQRDEQLTEPADPHSRGVSENEDWEPPSKKKKSNATRYANLPRRETTYRLAKNLDAVSRKAMEVYATSEMYAEQKNFRRRKSDPTFDDGPHIFESLSAPAIHHERSTSLVRHEDVLEISDSDSEPGNDDILSCRRTTPYQATARRSQVDAGLNGKSLGKQPNVDAAAEADEDTKGANTSTNRRKSGKRSTLPSSVPSAAQLSASEKLGLNRKQLQVSDESLVRGGKVDQKWKTQMVCLKAKKKNDDKLETAEIKLLEIISNCQWENQRTNMLSKISHAISKDPALGVTNIDSIEWDSYILHFLIRADKPAMIPDELKSKLPSEMFSIRIKVTQKNEVDLTKENEPIEIKDDEDEKKKFNLSLQKKLIDKIKFAERLRNLIISEEQKGVKSSKFSVSREGIERALKKYKTQLWKSYTGCSNMSLQQLKEAVLAAKAGAAKSQGVSSQPVPSVQVVSQSHSEKTLDTNTINRISMNQGLKIICPSGSGHANIPGSRLGQGSFQPFSHASFDKNNMLNKQHTSVTLSAPSTSSFSSRITVPHCNPSSLIGYPSVSFISESGKTGLSTGTVKVNGGGASVSDISVSSSSVTPIVIQSGVSCGATVARVNLPHSVVPIMISGPVSVHSNEKLVTKTKNVALPITGISTSSLPPNQILLVPVSQGTFSSSGQLVGSKVVLLETDPTKIAPGSTAAPVSVSSLKSQQRPASPARFVRPVNADTIQLVPTPAALNNSLRQALPGMRLQYHGTVPSSIYPIKMATPTCSSSPAQLLGSTTTPQSVFLTSVPPSSSVSGQAKSHISTPKAQPNTSPSKPCKPIVSETVSASAGKKQSMDKIRIDINCEDDDQIALDPETGLLSADKKIAETVETQKPVDVVVIKDEVLQKEDDVLISEQTPINIEAGVEVKSEGLEADNKDLLQVIDESKDVDLSDISKFREFEEVGNQLTEQIRQIVASETANEGPAEEVSKRKRESPDFLDDIENSQSTKKVCQDFTRITKNDSEDSDVDIMTCDFVPPKSTLSPATMSLSCLQFASEDSQGSGCAGLTKVEQEKSRRITLKYLLKNLHQVTFKYNQKLAAYKTGIPKHFVLAESVQLLKALKARNRSLEESLADGHQYQRSLQRKLEKLIESFVQSGIPENIIKNFLKSVSNAALATNTDNSKKPGHKSINKPDSESEESDTELVYERVTTKDVLSVHSPYTTLMKDKEDAEEVKVRIPRENSPPPFLRFRLGAQWENSMEGGKHSELPKDVSVERLASGWNHPEGFHNIKILENSVHSLKPAVNPSQRISNIESPIQIRNTDLKIKPALNTVNTSPRPNVPKNVNNHPKQTIVHSGVNYQSIDKSSIKINKAVAPGPAGFYHQGPDTNVPGAYSDKSDEPGWSVGCKSEPVVIDSDSKCHSSEEDEVRSSTGDHVMLIDDEMSDPLTGCLLDGTESEDPLRATVVQQIL